MSVYELEWPRDRQAPYRLEGRYLGSEVRFCHRGFETASGARRALAEEVADAERFGYACCFRLVKCGGEVRLEVTTDGRRGDR